MKMSVIGVGALFLRQLKGTVCTVDDNWASLLSATGTVNYLQLSLPRTTFNQPSARKNTV
jgi:hypothetical protein